MSIDYFQDQKIKAKKLEQLEHCLQLLEELEPSKKSYPFHAQYFERVMEFLQAEKERIESGVW